MPSLSLDDYLNWHRENLGEDLESAELRSIYAVNTRNLFSSVNVDEYFKNLQSAYEESAKKGLMADGQNGNIEFNVKSYESVINKVYRQNCHWNRRWPNEPKDGWVKFENIFQRIDDIIRATIVSRYLDGVSLLSQVAVDLSDSYEAISANASPRATDTGHYAWHVYVLSRQQIVTKIGVEEVEFFVEIQVITQLQSVLRGLTHSFYEKARLSDHTPAAERRWDYEASRFKGEFLGHTLHLVNSMILELRKLKEADDTQVSGVANG